MVVENVPVKVRRRKEYLCEDCRTSFATEKQLNQHRGMSHGQRVRTAIITISTHRETLDKIDSYLTAFNSIAGDKVSRSKFIIECVKEKLRETEKGEGLKAVGRINDV